MAGSQAREAPRGPVVAGVDGSPNSLAALRRAVYQARWRGAWVELVYVLPSGADMDAEAAAYVMLQMAVRCENPGGLDVPYRYTVAFGDPAESLVKHSTHADVLTIGGHGHSGPGSPLGGDVVPYCLTHAVCPVDVCADQEIPAQPDSRRRQR